MPSQSALQNVDSVAPQVRLLTVDEASEGQRLDNFLVKVLKGVPKSHVYRVIRSGEVRVNKARAPADMRLAMGDLVRVPPVRTAAPAAVSAPLVSAAALAGGEPFAVIHEDEHLLVIDKPAGVAVHGGSGTSMGVIEQLRAARPEARFLELVHRLDKDTSGLLMLAKKRSALTRLQAALREHQPEGSLRKTYRAVVWGAWPARHKVIDLSLHKGVDAQGERHVRVVPADHAQARRAITLVRVNSSLGTLDCPLSDLEVTLKTGRTHQIRVHLAHSGHAIVGDPRYGDAARNREIARGTGAARGLRFARMALHAQALSILHPASGERLMLQSPLPTEWLQLNAWAAERHVTTPDQAPTKRHP